jgi:outer membrane protein assembly factor BamB
MKLLKIVLLTVIALLPLLLVSCSIFGAAPVSAGWAGTTIQNGIVYAGTRNGMVTAVNSSSGSLQWSYTVGSAIYSTPIADGDLVYVGTYSGEVLALSTVARGENLTFPQQRYGEWQWDYPTYSGKSSAIVADLVISDDALYVASSNGRVYSLDKESGDENWNRENTPVLAEKLWTSPAAAGDTVYVSTFDGYIYTLSVETGVSLNWSFKGAAGFASSPVVYEDTIFVGSFDRHVYAVKTGSGEPTWRFPQERSAGNWFWACPLVSGGIVYVGGLDGTLYAVNAATGEQVWSYPTKDEKGITSGIIPPPILMENFLLVVNQAGNLYVFDLGAESGHQGVPSGPISIGVPVNSPFCAQNGTAYIRGEDDSLYIVDLSKGQVSSPIPLTGKQ